VIGTDPVTDLAVIKAQNVSGLTPARLGSTAALKVGQQVVAIGSPLGLSGTVTTGIVSALDRPVRTGGSESGSDQATVIDAVQTDAPINPGNSGGPLVDMDGRVVGINTAIASLGPAVGGQSGSIGLGFAIPIDQARPIAAQLAAGKAATHALLGVSVSDVTDRQGPSGAGVMRVESGSAAEAAGLARGDVITAVDGRTIDSADALIAEIRSPRPGDSVKVTYVRGAGADSQGSTTTKTVTLGTDTASTSG
jgi:putative serine protease PepD